MNKLSTLLFILPFSLISFAQSWQSVGGGTNNSSHGMLTWNGKLVNLGSFNSPCNRVATWDGVQWECLDGGVGIVARAGTVWNGKLVVVGDFWNNFQPCPGCNGVAVWDGVSWSALDQGFNNDVLTCTVYNGDLIIGGDFTAANGVPINRVARWNEITGSFESMGAVTDMDNDVRCMTVFDGELYVGGDFNNVGGNPPSDGLVKWDEGSQSWVGGNSGVDLVGGVNETVRVLYVNPNDGNLYMGGEFPELWDGDAAAEDFNMSGVAMYDGSNWYSLGTGLNEYCRAIHEYNGDLIVGGYFTTADGVACNKIAKWNTTTQTFSPMGLGFDATGIDEYVKSAEVWNGIFFAGGAYTQAEGAPMNYIAQWYEPPSTSPTPAISSSSIAECEGGCIEFLDNSTNGPTSWTWSFPGADTPSSTAQNPGLICYQTAGSYTVSLQACNANGCNTTTLDITISSSPSITVNSESICEGETTTITAIPSTSGGNYYWIETGEATSSISVSPASTSSYSVQYTLNGCTSTMETSTITVNPTPTLSVNSATICEGESATLTATPSSGGGNFLWSPGGESTNTINVSPSTTTTYTVDYTLNGCSVSTNTAVTVNPTYMVSENIPACENSTVTYPDGTTETITASTTHTSALTSIYGCDSVVITNVTMNPTYSENQNFDICSGMDYTFPDGAVHTNITNNETYTSTLTSSNGCDSLIVTNLTVVSTFSSTMNVSVCSGDDYTYPDGTVSSNITIDESHVSSLVSTFGCDSVVTTNISVDPTPVLTSDNATICEGESVTLLATASIGGGDYLWTPGGETTSSIIVSPGATSSYTVNYTLNGCTSNSSVSTVTVNQMPDITVSETNNVLTATQSGAGYQWLDCNNGNTMITGENSQSYTPASNGSYAVEINLGGCVDTSSCTAISTIGLDELNSAPITVHPNPATSKITISGKNILNQSYEIIDLTGKVLARGNLNGITVIDVTSYTKGVYFLRIEEGNYRFVKQ